MKYNNLYTGNLACAARKLATVLCALGFSFSTTAFAAGSDEIRTSDIQSKKETSIEGEAAPKKSGASASNSAAIDRIVLNQTQASCSAQSVKITKTADDIQVETCTENKCRPAPVDKMTFFNEGKQTSLDRFGSANEQSNAANAGGHTQGGVEYFCWEDNTELQCICEVSDGVQPENSQN